MKQRYYNITREHNELSNSWYGKPQRKTRTQKMTLGFNNSGNIEREKPLKFIEDVNSYLVYAGRN